MTRKLTLRLVLLFAVLLSFNACDFNVAPDFSGWDWYGDSTKTEYSTYKVSNTPADYPVIEKGDSTATAFARSSTTR